MSGTAKRFVMGIAASAIALALAAPAMAEDYIIDNVTLVDGTGQPNQTGMSIGVDKGKITFVTPTSVAPKVSGVHIDAKGKYLMPGMMDVHIHLKGARGPAGGPKLDAAGAHLAGLQALASYLYSGVTTVYDAGNVPEHIFGLRAEERAGKILSPRIFATGYIATYPGSHGDSGGLSIDNWTEDKPKLVKYLEEQKPDILKLTLEEHGWGTRPLIPLLPLDLMQEIILEANRHGIRTTAHTSSELRATEAIFAGIDSLAHPVIQGPITDEFARLMGAKKMPVATTLTIGEGYSRLVEHPEYLDQPLYQASYTAAEIAEMRNKTAPAWKDRGWTWWMKLMTPIAQENMRKIDAAGGVVAIATDQTIGPAVHREMELMQAAGVPARKIVVMATLNGAKHLGKDDVLGSIEPGKYADMVLLNADPTADVNNAKQIVWVMKAGQLIDEDKLPLGGGKRPLRRTQP
ncbi:amidohydrolase family protein [Sphingomonas sp. dw_22]|uniref:amidohydrolase family protein n=1 Tax=Sphingomonas sp. dw_22 TaxID=2721175 RepID=UPI001BD2E7EC|nr:amidohydrolase family protein [Sphingomonas sp. dw_22]